MKSWKKRLLYWLNKRLLQPAFGMVLLPTFDIDALVSCAMRQQERITEAETSIELLLRKRHLIEEEIDEPRVVLH